jgi:hypothetical protein
VQASRAAAAVEQGGSGGGGGDDEADLDAVAAAELNSSEGLGCSEHSGGGGGGVDEVGRVHSVEDEQEEEEERGEGEDGEGEETSLVDETKVRRDTLSSYQSVLFFCPRSLSCIECGDVC